MRGRAVRWGRGRCRGCTRLSVVLSLPVCIHSSPPFPHLRSRCPRVFRGRRQQPSPRARGSEPCLSAGWRTRRNVDDPNGLTDSQTDAQMSERYALPLAPMSSGVVRSAPFHSARIVSPPLLDRSSISHLDSWIPAGPAGSRWQSYAPQNDSPSFAMPPPAASSRVQHSFPVFGPRGAGTRRKASKPPAPSNPRRPGGADESSSVWSQRSICVCRRRSVREPVSACAGVLASHVRCLSVQCQWWCQWRQPWYLMGLWGRCPYCARVWKRHGGRCAPR